MRAVLFGVLVLLLPACENDKIAACGYACDNTNTKMASWSPTEGCRCVVPCEGDGGR